MLNGAILSEIRRWYYRDLLSLREIAPALAIPVIRFDVICAMRSLTRFIRNDTRPASSTPLRISCHNGWQMRRAARPSIKQLHADLCALGFEGSYDRVAVFARRW